MASGWWRRLIGASLAPAQKLLSPELLRGFLEEDGGVRLRSEQHGVTQDVAQTFRRLAGRLQRSLGPSARLPVKSLRQQA